MNIREVPLPAVLEASPGVTVVDTPGFNSSWGELEQLAALLQGLGEVDLFVVAWRHGDRFGYCTALALYCTVLYCTVLYCIVV